MLRAATSNFTGLTADQVGDLVKGLGEQYAVFKDSIVRIGLTGALVTQSMDDNDLADILKEVGVTSKLQSKAIEMKFKTFYQPKTSAVAGVTAAFSDVSLSTPVNRTGQHIMISYCWAQKALVTALAVYLREKYGYDVWMDEMGSTVCGKMSGASDAKMAEAVEKSHTVLVFVSKEYNASMNCQKEAKYAHLRRDRGKVKVHYVMMQREYTTVSKPDCIEGELALWIGNEIWYSLFDESQVAGTGASLADLIGEQGKLVGGGAGIGARA